MAQPIEDVSLQLADLADAIERVAQLEPDLLWGRAFAPVWTDDEAERIANLFRHLGLTPHAEAVMTMALGSSEVTS